MAVWLISGSETVYGCMERRFLGYTISKLCLFCNLCFWPIGCMYVSGEPSDAPTALRVEVLDVGQGLAVLFSWKGCHGLYDVGPDSVGVLDSLSARGVDSLEWVLLSHNHRDHAGGFLEILRKGASREGRLHVKRLFVGPDTAGAFVRDSVLRIALTLGIPVDTLVRGDSFVLSDSDVALSASNGDVPRFDVLWPPDYVRVGENAASVSVRVEYGIASMLLTGDLDSACERRLMELSPTLRADVLQIPHHGSASSNTLSFLSQLSPEYAVISVGEGNSYGHPAKSVVRKLQYVVGDSLRIFRTDRDGSVGLDLFSDIGVIAP